MSAGTSVDATTLLEQVINIALQSMQGPVIGKINTYDATTNRASVLPLVPLVVAGELIPSPVVPDVPVEWYGSTTISVKVPLTAGTIVSLEAKGHDHSEWITTGSEQIRPPSEHRFSLADLVARPLAPSPAATPPDPLSYDAAWGVLLGQWAAGGSDASDFVALASLTKANLDTLQAAHDAHTHPTAPTGPVSVPSIIVGALGNIAATKLKAK